MPSVLHLLRVVVPVGAVLGVLAGLMLLADRGGEPAAVLLGGGAGVAAAEAPPADDSASGGPVDGELQPPAAPPPVRTAIFRIGYLRREATGQPAESALEDLRDALLGNERVAEQLAEANYEGIGLYAADGIGDMLRRLNAREFDLAFVPAAIYLQQRGGYTVVLRSRRQEDIFAPGGQVWRLGTVFVSPRSPLFHEEEITAEAMREYLGRERLAVVSTQSVAGFHAPLLSLAVRYDVVAHEGGYLWFDSSEEVVKGVLSGLADIGAAERAAVDRVLRRHGLEERRGELLREILVSDRVATDPVVVRQAIAPERSALGRALRDAIREYSLRNDLSGIQYLPGTDNDYGSLIQLMQDFNEQIGEVIR